MRLDRSATQSLSSNTPTFISWDTQETAGGGTSNWSVSLPAASIAVPVAGTYLVVWSTIFQSSSSSYRLGWAEVNSASPASTRRYGEVQGPAASTSQTGFCGHEFIQLASNDTISIVALQGSGGALNLLGASPQVCSLRIVRVHE